MARLLSGIERRSTPENPNTPLTSSAVLDLFGATPTDSGIRVTPLRAMGFTPVWRAVRLISETISSLPLKVYRRTDKGREEARDHPAWSLLHDRPNAELTSQLWRELILGHLLLWGNAYCEIEWQRDRQGIVGLWPLPPDRVTVRRVDGARIYDVVLPDRPTPQVLAAEDVLHIPGLGFDGLKGYSPLALFREAIGIGVAMETYTAKWFGNGAHIGGFLEHPEQVSTEVDKRFKAQLAERSGLNNAHRLFLLEEGMKYRARGETPEHSQLTDGRVFQVQDVGRIFGVPPHLLFDTDRPFQSNVENEGIEFLTFTLRGWLVRCEQVYNWTLFQPGERGEYYSEHEVAGLLRGDFKTRMEGYEIARRQGLITANHVAARENWPPIESAYGDAFLVQQNQVMIASDGSIVPLNAPTGGAREVARVDQPNEVRPRGHEFRARLHQAFEPIFDLAVDRIVEFEVTDVRREFDKRSKAKDLSGFAEWFKSYCGDQRIECVSLKLQRTLRAFAMAVAREALAEIGEDVAPEVLEAEIGGLCCKELTDSFAARHVTDIWSELSEAIQSPGFWGQGASGVFDSWLAGRERLARRWISEAGATAASRTLTLCPGNGQQRMIAVL